LKSCCVTRIAHELCPSLRLRQDLQQSRTAGGKRIEGDEKRGGKAVFYSYELHLQLMASSSMQHLQMSKQPHQRHHNTNLSAGVPTYKLPTDLQHNNNNENSYDSNNNMSALNPVSNFHSVSKKTSHAHEAASLRRLKVGRQFVVQLLTTSLRGVQAN